MNNTSYNMINALLENEIHKVILFEKCAFGKTVINDFCGKCTIGKYGFGKYVLGKCSFGK